MTCRLLPETRSLRDSLISNVSDRRGDITLEAPGLASYINKSPLTNVEKCPIPFSINETLWCGVKVSWLGIFCILRGVFLPKSRPEESQGVLNISLSSRRSFELKFLPAHVRRQRFLTEGINFWPATHKNVNEWSESLNRCLGERIHITSPNIFVASLGFWGCRGVHPSSYLGPCHFLFWCLAS